MPITPGCTQRKSQSPADKSANFPHGSTHLAQIDTALTLNSQLQRR
jgi:hypothetical protein